MTEPTVQLEYDVRFEAPDFIVQGQRMHTPYTDVWRYALTADHDSAMPINVPSTNNGAIVSLC
jgi:hypothetical protein